MNAMDPKPMSNTGYIPSHHPNQPTIAGGAVPSNSIYVAPIDGLPIFMQGTRPTCVSHGVAWAKMQHDLKHTGSFKVLSRRFLHALSKLPGQVPGDGRSIDKVLAVAEEFGIPEEEYFPEDDSLTAAQYEDPSKIPQAAYDNAKLHKVGSHGYLTDLSIPGIYAAVVAHDIVIIGMDISTAWWSDTAGDVTWDADKIMPLRPGYNGDRHCVDIYAANTGQSLGAIMNWWSINWGIKGTGFFETNDLPYIYEACVITS